MASNRSFNVQTLYIDAAAIADVNSATLPYSGQLGQIFNKDGKLYQLVKFKDAAVVGNAVMWTDFDAFEVSPTVASAKRNFIAGVALGTVTDEYFAFIQVGGPGSVLFSQGTSVGGTDAASGEECFMSATDGQVDRISAGTAATYQTLGVFTAADTGGAAAIQIRVPLNV